MRKYTAILFSFMLILSVFLVGCSNQGHTDVSSEERTGENQSINEVAATEVKKLLIYTSIYPLYDFTKKVAGDKADVFNLVPVGVEPHDFEPTARQIAQLSRADLFIYNGGGFEGWIERILEAINQQNLVVVDSTELINLLSPDETGHSHDHDHGHGHSHDHDYKHDHKHDDHEHKHDDHEHKHDDHEHKHDDHEHKHDNEHKHDDHEDKHDHDHHGHGEFDPHVWVDPLLAKKQAEAILNGLIQVDPANESYYRQNFGLLAAQFDRLHEAFVDMTQHIERKDFVVSHSAFGYLAHRYGLNQVAIAGIDPTVEPSARALQQIIEFVKEHRIKYILFENMVTPRVAEIVRAEVGAESLILHNLEGLTQAELDAGKDYFSIMEDNLAVLKQALDYNK